MTNTELVNILKTLQEDATTPITVNSVRAKLGTKVPYLVINYNASNNYEADDKAFYKEQFITLELYTVGKDETAEGKVETLLDSHYIPWDKDEAFEDSTNLYINYYTILRR